MKRLRDRVGRLLCGALLGSALLLGLALGLFGPDARAQQILQYGFEARDPVWKPDRADAAYKVLTHRLTEETAHGGLRSEHLQIRAEKGTHIHYVFKVGRAPVTEELNVGLWLKSNRPGVELLCRVVLPRERDPANLSEPLTLLLRCEPYQTTRWKLLSLNQPIKRLREQQQLLQAQYGRDVITADAYISELVLNVYDGPGITDVWIDDLEVGPVFDSPSPSPAPAPGRTASQEKGPRGPQGGSQTNPALPGRSPIQRPEVVTIQGQNLMVNGQRFFLRGIRHTGTPLKVLREAGFNVVWLDETTPPGLIEDAVNLGFWLVPTITPPRLAADGRTEGQLTTNDAFVSKVSRFLDQDNAVLCWDLGSNLTAENFLDVARTARAFRAADPMRPVSADVWDGFRSYSRSLEQMMVGVHRWPLMTSLELSQYREWMLQRRRLTSPGSYCWTWIQNHLPDWFLDIGHEGGTGKEPMGPTPDQVRLLTYTALGCGYRGLGYWSDRSLADSSTGRDRLLGLALLNLEMQMLEPLILEADASKDPEWIDTSNGNVRAAVLRTPKGVLVLPMWLGDGSQYVPGQGASMDLKVIVPLVPATAQAWEVSPGRVASYKTKRVLGGVEVHLHNFSLTSALLMTSDLSPTGIVVRLQDQQRRMGRHAAQWSQQEAQEMLAKVEQVQKALEEQGKAIPDSKEILKKVHESLDACVVHRQNGEHGEAYSDAQSALRGLRVLMRGQWDNAVRNLDNPVASPYSVSYFTLPKHYRLLDELHQLRPAKNVLPGGDFESPPDRVPAGWLVEEVPSLDSVTLTARRVKELPLQGKQCLRLSVEAKGPGSSILERTFLAIHSPAVRLKPGSLVRISAWVRTPGLSGSADGALIYDSACGEPLAVRVQSTKGWRRVALYRRVPPSGTINVTLATSALGKVMFDNVQIEPLVPAGPGDRQAPAATGRPVADGR